MKFIKTIAAVSAALVASICGANAAQHPYNPTVRVDIPALVSPFAMLEKASPAAERIVLAQRRIRRGPRRTVVVRRRGIGPGGAAAIIGLGIAGAAIASSAARANDYEGSPRYCRRLIWRCDHGERWACRQYNRVC